MQDVNLTIRMTSELKARLKARADAEKRTISQVVNLALEQAAQRWSVAAVKGKQ